MSLLEAKIFKLSAPALEPYLKKVYSKISSGKNLKELLREKISIKEIAELQKKEAIYIEFPCLSKRLKNFYINNFSCLKNPAFSNIVAYEKEWKNFDFLDKNSTFYYLKKFEEEIYLEEIEKYLKKLPKNSHILDAGGGIGRFALYLLKKGYSVSILDASYQAILLSFYHLSKTGKKNFDLFWGEVEDLSYFPENNFEATLSIEVICYVQNPEKALKELVRVTKKNGIIIVSVEAKYGSLVFDTNISLKYFENTYKNSSIHIKDNLYVRYFTEDSFRNILKKSGIKILYLKGCHYVAEGILDRLVEPEKLKYKNYREKLKNIEKLCRKDKYLKNFPRAYLAVGIKK